MNAAKIASSVVSNPRVRLLSLLLVALTSLPACEARPNQAAAPAPASSPGPTASRSPALASARPANEEAAPPAASQYDLAADVRARTELARAEFGAKTPVEVEAGVFVVVGTYPGALPSSMKLTHDTLAAYFNGRFDKRPERAVTVFLFGEAGSYNAFCKKRKGEACMSPFGFYQPTSREIIMNAGPGLGTLTHELVHPIVETDFPSAPIWINEGIASLFEQPQLPRAGEIHGGKNWRHPRLLAALVSTTEAPEARLDTLFGMSDGTFRGGKEALHYAMARYVCQWLDGKGLLWPFYRAWRDGFAADPTGENTFAKVVGKAPADANADWVAWVKHL